MRRPRNEAVTALNRAAAMCAPRFPAACTSARRPRFVFCADDGAAYAAHINELLAGLRRNPASRRRSKPKGEHP